MLATVKISSLSIITLFSIINSSLSCMSKTTQELSRVECNYEVHLYVYLGQTYHCNVKSPLNIDTPQKALLTSVTGKHVSGKDDQSVKGFYATSTNIEYFPRGLQKIFVNLISINIRYDKLKELHQADLQEYTNLVSLRMERNKIEVLEEGLFDYNPNLKLISFDNNKLVKIHPNLFDNLSKLSYLYLKDNPCVSMKSVGNVDEVKKIIETIKIKCDDEEN